MEEVKKCSKWKLEMKVRKDLFNYNLSMAYKAKENNISQVKVYRLERKILDDLSDKLCA